MTETPTATTRRPHRRYLHSSGFLNDLLIGAADGILLPFALVLALSFMLPDTRTIALVAAAESLLLALLFGFAAYQTVVNQAQEYPDGEDAETSKGFIPHLQLIQILRNLNLEPEVLEKAALDGRDYEARWDALLNSYGLGEPVADYRRARKNGLFVALAFLLGSLLPLAPYLWVAGPLTALRYAAGFSLAGLLVFGFGKAAYTGSQPWGSLIRLLITGLVIALVVGGVILVVRP